MDDEADPLAEHLVQAARVGSQQAMSREQFCDCAGIFWDAVKRIQALSTDHTKERDDG